MTKSPDPHRLGKEGLRKRAAERCDVAMRVCTVPGCGRLPEAAAGQGLSLYLCRYHRQFKARHAAVNRGTYSASELKPYRWAAARVLKAHSDDIWIVNSLTAIEGHLEGAGRVQRSYDLPRLPAATKARIAFARLREADVPPMRILMNCLAVTGAIAEDPIGPGCDRKEFRWVQLAKAAFRGASGNGNLKSGASYKSNHYPRSSGQALRVMGRELDDLCEFVIRRYLDEVISVKRERYGVREAEPTPPSSPRSKFGNDNAPTSRISPERVPAPMPEPTEGSMEDTPDLQAELAAKGLQAFAGKF